MSKMKELVGTESTEDEVAPSDELSRASEDVQLFIKFGNSGYPHRRAADATFSKLESTYDGQARIWMKDAPHPAFTYIKGVNMIVGGAGVGKTSYMRHAAKAGQWRLINCFEPVPEASSITSVDQLCEAIHFFLRSEEEVLLIDSLKALIYRKGGALSKGGVDMLLMQELSNLSAVAARHNKVIVASLNIGTDDATIYDNVLEALRTNVAGVFELRTNGHVSIALRDFEASARGDFKNARPVYDVTWATKTKTNGDGGDATSVAVRANAETHLAAALHRAANVK